MQYRNRIYYTDAQKSQMWDRWQKGESLHDIGRLFERGHGSIAGILSRAAGIRPRQRTRSQLSLTLSEREDISRGIVNRPHFTRDFSVSLGNASHTLQATVDY